MFQDVEKILIRRMIEKITRLSVRTVTQPVELVLELEKMLARLVRVQIISSPIPVRMTAQIDFILISIPTSVPHVQLTANPALACNVLSVTKD